MKEISFESLKNDFDGVCNQVNDNKDVITLTLKSNRKVFIMPEENYDEIDRFVITNLSAKSFLSLN